MSYLLLATLVLFLPGYCLVTLVGFTRFRFLLSFALSYALFVILFKTLQLAGSGIIVFERAWLATMLALILAVVVGKRDIWQSPGDVQARLRQMVRRYRQDLLAMMLIAVSLTIYYVNVGPYLELPADVFRHLEFIQKMKELLAASALAGGVLPEHYTGVNGKYWHLLYVLLNDWAGTGLTESILRATLFNNAVFLIGVYFFSKVVFGDGRLARGRLVAVALAVALFYFIYFGVNIFSFIRYYALAPVMLNMVLYFAIMAVVIQFFREQEWRFREILAAAFIFAATLLIHKQESLYVVVMVLLMSGYLFFHRSLPALHESGWPGCGPRAWLRDKPTLVFVPMAIGTMALHAWSIAEVTRRKVETPKLIPVENLLPFVKNLYILNPTYQFYYVLSLWGLAVIVLYVFHRRHFRGNAFIAAGMLSPLFTVFNPVFVDLFLRYSYSIMLWRLSFLVPVCFVGGYLFVEALTGLWQGGGRRRMGSAVTVTLLILLLFPIHTTFIDTPYSRFETLKAVPHRVSPAYWRDLLDFLDGIEDKKIIITDPVTGYLVSAMTHHYSYRAKFHRIWGGYIDFNFEDFSTHPFDQYAGRLLIINLRNGGMSRTGRIARHWPANILQVGNFYQMERLGPYIESQPERFELLWEQDRIRVYLIHRPS